MRAYVVREKETSASTMDALTAKGSPRGSALSLSPILRQLTRFLPTSPIWFQPTPPCLTPQELDGRKLRLEPATSKTTPGIGGDQARAFARTAIAGVRVLTRFLRF